MTPGDATEQPTETLIGQNTPEPFMMNRVHIPLEEVYSHSTHWDFAPCSINMTLMRWSMLTSFKAILIF